MNKRKVWGITLLAGAGLWFLLWAPYVFAQACKDETSLVDGSKQALTEFTETVKNESLPKFETSNHQKGAVNKLSFHDGMLGELISCLQKAAEHATTSKEDAAAAKAQQDGTVKLREKVKRQQAAIKGAATSKDAKALIEKLDLSP